MKAVIALGANIGDPKAQMDLAVAMLREATDVISVSEYFSTKPVSDIEQPDYLNAVCIVESELPAMDLLSLLHGIEKALGRQRLEKWGPRTIDLDLIQYGSLLSSADELKLPHPRAHERRFVLEPWVSIDPEAILLTHGKISELLVQLP
ncbi:2-amino-4-hydroxy-6-hydroxymethyldihydropteridine diphosphokinase [Candidatus Planktophila lacus]|jgi:2-amino-4-hydroxy-6-hydroxymethyldihydropteridine diphosphokinase|uniref:2-amino-4-hydroxy-6-hydroxymethyldihydropteridine diphosphokinase n=1 Tax=Candidatus Planktophila lacus TaxID=1884913 RepID=A0AAC9YS43_9ACTN|nr:2-amino-4-hydroxy-6-hydroxymethyldihydropteridine diphosphokinase [Candidatus Planktophila lacus]ASY11145.1 2-amino-4-hydroxy-6-hydroxymethyldihydropteridine diphosphokinase [Candidatus Planktophila lacus]ASY25586.1 2-amino-4-hydroxy-6-hydroxymethyldihydropteridine diphosphokinase [Candidatus Planktophila lacus]